MENLEITKKQKRFWEIDELQDEALRMPSLRIKKRLSPCKSTGYREILAGSGKCTRCSCREFEKEYGSWVCKNCGHKYSDHW